MIAKRQVLHRIRRFTSLPKIKARIDKAVDALPRALEALQIGKTSSPHASGQFFPIHGSGNLAAMMHRM
jgi:hypothetical protein